MRFFYDSTGKRVGFANGTMLFYYLYNLQGDVVAIVRAATGQIVATYSYDAWGKCTVTNATGYAVATRIPSATGGIITTPRRGFITSTAAIITRSSGGLSMLTRNWQALAELRMATIFLPTVSTIP